MEMNLVNKSPYLDKYAKQLARPFTNNCKALVVTRGLASDHGRLNNTQPAMYIKEHAFWSLEGNIYNSVGDVLLFSVFLRSSHGRHETKHLV